MTSFIELPRVSFGGEPPRVTVVNADHILTFEPTSYGARVHVEGIGSEGSGVIETTIPYEILVSTLGVVAWQSTVHERWATAVRGA